MKRQTGVSQAARLLGRRSYAARLERLALSGNCSRGFETAGLVRFRTTTYPDRVLRWLNDEAMVDVEERELLKTERKLYRRSFAWAKSDSPENPGTAAAYLLSSHPSTAPGGWPYRKRHSSSAGFTLLDAKPRTMACPFAVAGGYCSGAFLQVCAWQM
jgi:hypothetical protein